ncbi:hypothetical protein JCGZ_04135 [Jatropha curcas]|uniref:Uncharacterized protein n=1 Tax=Jatropha curcas TaxID=180498 RepID=A0A067JA12_JATCU|nr:hypothetical protein JCGZ_04135 [Jatropha curcas]
MAHDPAEERLAARLEAGAAAVGTRRSYGTCWRAMEAVRLKLARGGDRLMLLELLAVTQTLLQGRRRGKKERKRKERKKKKTGGGGGGVADGWLEAQSRGWVRGEVGKHG